MRILSILMITLFISACGTTEEPRPIQVNTDNTIVCQKAQDAEKITVRDIEFHVIKSENGIYYIGLLPKHYENLSLNMQDIIKHIEQKNGIIEYYEDCLIEDDKTNNENKN